MDDPLKVIHKYKNNDGRVQYHVHIFIGDIVTDSCMKILNKIKDLDLFTSLITLTKTERNTIEKAYGNFWYEKFFNSYHINNTKETTAKNKTRIQELVDIYGQDWVTEHFINYIKRVETVTFSYEYAIKEDRERKTINKIMTSQQQDAEDNIFYSADSRTVQSRIEPQIYSKTEHKYSIAGKGTKFEITGPDTNATRSAASATSTPHVGWTRRSAPAAVSACAGPSCTPHSPRRSPRPVSPSSRRR